MADRADIDPNAPQAFLSYAHADDEFLDGAISRLRTDIEGAFRFVSGRPFKIFQDRDGIGFGQDWLNRLDEALAQARFLIPILTPSYFASQPCRDEAERFFEYEKAAGRNDLVLPIYLADAAQIEDRNQREADSLARRIHARQYRNWRHLAFEPVGSQRLRSEVTKLAKDIRDAAARSQTARRVDPVPTEMAAELLEPEQDPGLDAALEEAREEIKRLEERAERDRDEIARLERIVADLKAKLASFEPQSLLKVTSSTAVIEIKYQPGTVFRDIDAPWCPEMVVIRPGRFVMGSPPDEGGANEQPEHRVRISEAFALGGYPVTFEEYDHFCLGTSRRKPPDEGWGRGRRPVINVSYKDAEAYLVVPEKRLSL